MSKEAALLTLIGITGGLVAFFYRFFRFVLTVDPIHHITDADALPCTCGHPAVMHLHHRAGYDCGTCGKDGCPIYTADPDAPVDMGEVAADDRLLDAVGPIEFAETLRPIDPAELAAHIESWRPLLDGREQV